MLFFPVHSYKSASWLVDRRSAKGTFAAYVCLARKPMRVYTGDYPVGPSIRADPPIRSAKEEIICRAKAKVDGWANLFVLPNDSIRSGRPLRKEDRFVGSLTQINEQSSNRSPILEGSGFCSVTLGSGWALRAFILKLMRSSGSSCFGQACGIPSLTIEITTGPGQLAMSGIYNIIHFYSPLLPIA